MTDNVLNYVWIQPDHIRPPRIPETILDVALKASRRQPPGVDVFLWLDSAQGVELPARDVQRAGIEVRDLRELKAYTENPLFSAGHDGCDRKGIIWHQVDLARILVLQHSLEAARYKTAVYCDLDMKPRSAAGMQDVMDAYGMFFGARAYGRGDTILENQFIAVAARRKDFIAETLLPEMHRTIAEGKEPNGLSALYRALDRQFPELGGDLTPLTKIMIEQTASAYSKWHMPQNFDLK